MLLETTAKNSMIFLFVTTATNQIRNRTKVYDSINDYPLPMTIPREPRKYHLKSNLTKMAQPPIIMEGFSN